MARPNKRRKRLGSKSRCINPQVSFPESHEKLCQQISQILGQSRAPRTTSGAQNDHNDLEELQLKKELKDPSVDCIYFCDVNSLESKLVPVQNQNETSEIVKTEKVDSVFIKKEGFRFNNFINY